MKITDYATGVLAALSLLGTQVTADAASLFLVPSTATQNVVDGDIVSFDIHMDFSDDPTIGGGFNIYFDSSALAFVSFFRDESIGDPAFSRDPDILDGFLDSWFVGDVEGLPEIAILGYVVFQVLPAMGRNTTVVIRSDSSICGCWVSVDFVSIIQPDYSGATISRVPLPAAVWFMLSGLGVLFGFLRTTPRRV